MKVMTVTGPIDSTELGLVLPHEHLHNSQTLAYSPSAIPEIARELDTPVRPEIAWLLRENPYHSRDNCGVRDTDAVLEDLRDFRTHGGRTVIDLTTDGIGRNPGILRAMSSEADVHVIMGSGWYLESTHPPEVATLGVDDLAQTLIDEFTAPTSSPRPGVIGELGISPSCTPHELKALRSACIAQREIGVPLFIHLPGWKRVGMRILDLVVNEMGVSPDSVVLCHMDPSGADQAYQNAIADTGVYLEFDMIGMPFNFPGEGQSPAPHETAEAIMRLLSRSHADRLLLSHDMFLTSMLRKHGGNGLSYVPVAFAARLRNAGVTGSTLQQMMEDNPRALFDAAAAKRKAHEQ